MTLNLDQLWLDFFALHSIRLMAEDALLDPEFPGRAVRAFGVLASAESPAWSQVDRRLADRQEVIAWAFSPKQCQLVWPVDAAELVVPADPQFPRRAAIALRLLTMVYGGHALPMTSWPMRLDGRLMGEQDILLWAITGQEGDGNE